MFQNSRSLPTTLERYFAFIYCTMLDTIIIVAEGRTFNLPMCRLGGSTLSCSFEGAPCSRTLEKKYFLKYFYDYLCCPFFSRVRRERWKEINGERESHCKLSDTSLANNNWLGRRVWLPASTAAHLRAPSQSESGARHYSFSSVLACL